VVAGRVGGIVDQIEDGDTGFLVSSVEECAEKTRLVLDTPAHARELSLRGKEHVRRHFLTPRLLRDWLVHFNELEGNGGDAAELVESLRTA
jgi:trehalose synthase